MDISWKSSLEVGFTKIDMQHKELFDRLAKVSHAIKSSLKESEIIKTLEFLEKYVQEHFSTEEALMDKANYSGKDFHKLQHKQFASEYNSIKKKILLKGVEEKNSKELIEFIADWLVGHISNTDQLLGKYLKQKGIE